MKIALTTLNAKYIHSNLALRYLFAVAGQARNTLEIREFTINHEDDYIYTELLRGEYGAICFSCYIWNIERILYLAETIKKAKPDLIIVLGGPEAGHRGEELLKNYKAIDLIVMGEGEETFPDLLALLLKQSPRDLEAISGLIYRRNGDICVNPAREV
ncbi:MAG: cobalamin-dependent protein, partial [Methanosarcina sp.]|nr:cobalamin-dependent protein [Methanosarcina sp.]